MERKENFISQDKEQWLLDNGWELRVEFDTMLKFTKPFSNGYGYYMLYIQYSGNGKHYCNLYSGSSSELENDSDCKYFSLRNLKSMIVRYTEEE